ncbi:hypothetical protein Nepgr_006430 [Nepenthes gracilis]|uniref:Uncharacterized protein n=1 Tax=Nepenthes gracilis TaxID=150966 RepID=A0AAD3XHE5_NEPGR|nr:hypothetical protein Nepgr_006430 [Nepenthes gracilis]
MQYEEVVNAGTAIFISPSGPNTIMVQLLIENLSSSLFHFNQEQLLLPFPQEPYRQGLAWSMDWASHLLLDILIYKHKEKCGSALTLFMLLMTRLPVLRIEVINQFPPCQVCRSINQDPINLNRQQARVVLIVNLHLQPHLVLLVRRLFVYCLSGPWLQQFKITTIHRLIRFVIH